MLQAKQKEAEFELPSGKDIGILLNKLTAEWWDTAHAMANPNLNFKTMVELTTKIQKYDQVIQTYKNLLSYLDNLAKTRQAAKDKANGKGLIAVPPGTE